MSDIKFGTDGWRAIIAKEYTVANVARVAHATATWLKKNFPAPSAVVGHDCRFGGEMFARSTAMILADKGVKVYIAKDFVSTPMVSLGVVSHKASVGVVITASHNPAEYNGFKLKGHYGGPLLPEKIAEVEAEIPASVDFEYDEHRFESLIKGGQIVFVNLEDLYIKRIEETFDLEAIRNAKLNLAYDAMYGAGQNVLKRLFPDMTFLHCEHNPGFKGQAPEPIHKNLIEFSDLIKKRGNIDCGLATDGDADRIGLYNSRGEFVDSHHLILLLIKYLVEVKGFTGKVVTAFSTSVKIPKMCAHFNLPYQVTKIGFKYISEYMISEDVLLGGEESGGIAIKGHIPERDGIWMGLVIWEYMAKTGKSLDQLIQEVYAIVGEFAFHRVDLHLQEAVKQKIIRHCEGDDYKSFGTYALQSRETLDGYKYFINNDEWLMIRPSGTEPVLRTYAEASSRDRAEAILEACKSTLLA
ncbi:MAG TPA: phosphoglucomutase/phosphomannomutase family protein [Luteibaculaceae bacterium]|nr:phosphoglucomutase/phosphomannomutase family protein [Luteibaculaceae bacterium]